MKLNCESKGQIAQLKVQLRAAEKNIITSIPTIPARYDVILNIDKTLLRTQIKYCNALSKSDNNKHNLRLILKQKYAAQNRHGSPYTKDEIDLLLVYIPKLDKILSYTSKVFHNNKRIQINLNNPKSKWYWKKFEW